MKIFLLWVEDDNLEFTQCRIRDFAGNVSISRTKYFDLDHRSKAPRKRLARQMARLINSQGDNASVTLINHPFRVNNSSITLISRPNNPSLLWTKLKLEIEKRCLCDFYIIAARDSNQMLRKFIKRMTPLPQ